MFWQGVLGDSPALFGFAFAVATLAVIGLELLERWLASRRKKQQH